MIRLLWLPLVLMLATFFSCGGVIGWILREQWINYQHSRIEKLYRKAAIKEDKEYRAYYAKLRGDQER